VRFIRSDLQSIFKVTIRGINQDLRTEFWHLIEGASPSQSAIRSITKRFSGPAFADQLFGTLAQNAVDESLTAELNRFLASPMITKVWELFVYQFFVPGPSALPRAVRAAMQTVPAKEREIFSPDLEVLAAPSGVLASPTGFRNPLLTAVETSTDRTLVNVRDFVLNWTAFWRAMVELAEVIVQRYPAQTLGSFAAAAPSILRVLSAIRPGLPMNHFHARLVVLGFLILRPQNSTDEAEPLARAVKVGIPSLLSWLARNLEQLHAVDSDRAAAVALIESADLPAETRLFLLSLRPESQLEPASRGAPR
jgi:hypothetical protein